MNLVSLSGGKDSTAMLLMMIERGIAVDKVVFVDTTKEFPQMYDHLEKLKRSISPLEITTIKIDFDYWFSEHIKTKGINKGSKGYGFPDIKNRWCTALKRGAILKEVSRLSDVTEFHGIASDEPERLKIGLSRNIRYPLVEWGISENQALEYCYSKGFDWGGLYHRFDRVSCWCCPFSRIWELRELYTGFPELWSKLLIMDRVSPRRFSYTKTVSDLDKRFKKEISRFY